MTLTYRVYFTLRVTHNPNCISSLNSVPSYEGSTWLRKIDPASFGDISAYVGLVEMSYAAQSLLNRASGRHWMIWRRAKS